LAYQATTGLGTPTQIIVQGNETPESTTPGYNVVNLSLTSATWPSTFQLAPSIVDASGAEQAVGTAFTLTAAAAASPGPYTLTAVAASSGQPGVAVYTGTITSGGSNAFAGRQFVIAGFTGANNNGTFQCTASTTTTLTLTNTAATAETHAGTAQDQTAVAVYTGTITGGGSNAFAGSSFVVAGFVTHTVNNGTFICTASNTTTLTLANPAALAETHAATATDQESTAITFVAYSGYAGASQACVTVSSAGVITAAYKGAAVVEVSYPTFNNTVGDIVSSGNIMNGLPINKIYAEVNVNVLA
jgi:hypothetical protein